MRAHPVRHGLLFCLLLCGLASCGGTPRPTFSTNPTRDSYPAPGPPDDPWGPYIDEASQRFGVPGQWVRAVMHQESGGHEYLDGQPITSAAGAIGLMQLMPATYGDLQAQYGLGGDPFDPHDNIMAGTAYIRQMYDRYGSPGFLAAYNAGPARVDDYLAGQGGLPNETVNYVAAIAPHLGGGGATGSGVRFAATPALRNPAPRALAAGGCTHDPDAAYDPAAPCWTPPALPPAAIAPRPTELAAAGPTGCAGDPDAAYDPDAACPAARPGYARTSPVRAIAFRPAPSVLLPDRPTPAPVLARPAVLASVPVRAATPVRPSQRPTVLAGGAWAVQVGAFGRPEEARFAIELARDAAPPLGAARSVVQPVGGLGGRAVYRARLAGLARNDAAAACARLRAQSLACLPVPPGT